MINEEYPRGITPQPQGRKPITPRYQDTRYSPSANYNYNSNGGYQGQQMHPRRRIERFKRDQVNSNDKLMRQNDIIIRLLKEIRDRLPPPPGSAPANGEAEMVMPGNEQPEMDKFDDVKVEAQEVPPEGNDQNSLM